MQINTNIFPANFSDYLAKLFKEVKLQLDLTQQEMAKIFGTSQRVYQRWETGNSEPRGELTAKLFLMKNHLSEKQNSIKFTNPSEIAKKILQEIGA